MAIYGKDSRLLELVWEHRKMFKLVMNLAFIL